MLPLREIIHLLRRCTLLRSARIVYPSLRSGPWGPPSLRSGNPMAIVTYFIRHFIYYSNKAPDSPAHIKSPGSQTLG